MAKRILFTGGAGKAGRHVVPYLVARGHRVLNVDRVPLNAEGVDNLIADITDSGQMFNAMTSYAGFDELEPGTGVPRFDAVVHFAAVPRILLNADNEMFRINTQGTYNVIEAAVKLGIRKIVIATTRLTWVTAGYGWLTIVAPILVAAPVYFAGDLTFGGLMMAVGAFTQVHNSLRWFVDNFGAIADWRATLLRVASFRQAVLRMDDLGRLDRQVELAVNKDESLTLDGVCIAAPDVCLRLSRKTFKVAPGERVLVTGGTETQRTLLFRALGGLWPWGEGRIGMPADDGVAFMPRAPYFPPGTLKGVIAYPLDLKKIPSEALETVLKRAGLERLSGSLDRAARWDRILTEDEQQCLAFARLILSKPHWIIVDGVMDGLDSDAYDRIRDLLDKELKAAALIHLGKSHLHDGLFSRQIALVDDRDAPPLELPVLHQPQST